MPITGSAVMKSEDGTGDGLPFITSTLRSLITIPPKYHHDFGLVFHHKYFYEPLTPGSKPPGREATPDLFNFLYHGK